MKVLGMLGKKGNRKENPEILYLKEVG